MPGKPARQEDPPGLRQGGPAEPPARPSACAAPGASRLRGMMPLVLLPLVLAAALVTVMALFGWLALASDRPEDLIRQMQRVDRNSWRQAVSLVQLLRDPAHAALRQDRRLAAQLAAILQAELDSGLMDEDRLRLRSFLCRALGQFGCPEVLPVLVRAAGTERDLGEIDVRRSALEGLADFAGALREDTLKRELQRGEPPTDADLLTVMLQATRLPAGGEVSSSRDALRATASFALGVLGGESALSRLLELLDDPHADVRYNAATGLARHGRVEAEGVLLEMLDPAAVHAFESEMTVHGRTWKRQIVLRNALRSVESLAAQRPLDTARLMPAVRRLAQEAGDVTVQRQARQTLQAMPPPLASGYDD